MFKKEFELEEQKELYIRIPEELQNENNLQLNLPKELAGKTLKIVVVENDNAPYESDEVYSDGWFSTLRYYGDVEYWKPYEDAHTVVEGNPDCSYSECNYDCHVVSCAVHQGFASRAPMKISHIRSKRLKK